MTLNAAVVVPDLPGRHPRQFAQLTAPETDSFDRAPYESVVNDGYTSDNISFIIASAQPEDDSRFVTYTSSNFNDCPASVNELLVHYKKWLNGMLNEEPVVIQPSSSQLNLPPVKPQLLKPEPEKLPEEVFHKRIKKDQRKQYVPLEFYMRDLQNHIDFMLRRNEEGILYYQDKPDVSSQDDNKSREQRSKEKQQSGSYSDLSSPPHGDNTKSWGLQWHPPEIFRRDTKPHGPSIFKPESPIIPDDPSISLKDDVSWIRDYYSPDKIQYIEDFPDVWHDSDLHGNILFQSGTIDADLAYVGNTGAGSLIQQGGTHSLGYFYAGFESTSKGEYKLENGLLSSYQAVIGVYGTGEFTQSGGEHKTNSLYLGYSSTSTGTYTLKGGSLTTDDFVIGRGGTGKLRIESKSANLTVKRDISFYENAWYEAPNGATITLSSASLYVDSWDPYTMSGFASTNIILTGSSNLIEVYDIPDMFSLNALVFSGIGTVELILRLYREDYASAGLSVKEIIIKSGTKAIFNLAGRLIQYEKLTIEQGGSYSIVSGYLEKIDPNETLLLPSIPALQLQPVPEPSAIFLTLFGAIILKLLRKNRK